NARGTSHIVYEPYDGTPGTSVTPIGDHVDRDPSWIGAEAWHAAYDAQAQENLVAAADTAQSIGDSTGSFENAGPFAMANALPALTFLAAGTASTIDYEISVDPETSSWAAAALSYSGPCFWIKITV